MRQVQQELAQQQTNRDLTTRREAETPQDVQGGEDSGAPCLDERMAAQRLAERLRLVRRGRGLLQGEVAERMGMARPRISEIEAGTRAVSALELLRFADLYRVTPNDLLCADGRDERLRLARFDTLGVQILNMTVLERMEMRRFGDYLMQRRDTPSPQ